KSSWQIISVCAHIFCFARMRSTRNEPSLSMRSALTAASCCSVFDVSTNSFFPSFSACFTAGYSTAIVLPMPVGADGVEGELQRVGEGALRDAQRGRDVEVFDQFRERRRERRRDALAVEL